MHSVEDGLESIAGFRLAPAQVALWRAPVPAFSRARIALESAITPEWLAETLEQIAAANDSMRVALQELPGLDVPLQVIGDRLDPQVTHETLWAFADDTAAVRTATLWDTIPDPRWHAGGLLWATLVDLPGGRQLIQLVTPAIVADAESLAVILRGIAARIRGEALPLAGEVQYLHYSQWCHDTVDSDAALDAREHWRRVQADRRALRLPLERDTAARAQGVIERRCPPFAEADALAAWAAVLGRYGDTHALTLHRRFRERPFAELADAIGPMTVDLPLPLAWRDEQRWSAFVAGVGEAIAQAEQARFAFDPARWPVERDAIGFAWRSAESGLAIEYQDAPDTYALALDVQHEAAALVLRVRFDPGLHDRSGIERIADALAATLAASDPDGAIGGGVRLGADERVLLEAWSGPATVALSEDTIPTRFAQIVARQPDAPAVRTLDATLSYAELDARADAIATRLAGMGVLGARVALIAERDAATIAAMLGVLKAGAAFVPIDPTNPPQRITQLIAAADVAVVLGAPPPGVLFDVPLLTLDPDAPGEIAPLPLAEVSADSPAADSAAYVIFTSGSTGAPKGVVVTHRSAINLAEALQERIYRDQSLLTVSINAPFSFDASIKQFVQLLNGHCLAPIPEAARRDAAALLGLVRDQRIDVLDCTPSHLKLLFAAGFAHWGARYPQIVLVGGEPIDAATWSRLAAHPAAFWNVYGPTETTVNATVAEIDGEHAPTIGRPLRNVTVRLVDDALAPVPIGVPGEILIGGAGVALGYLGDRAQTDARFVVDQHGARAYRSGDRGVYDAAGNLHFIGRIDDQLKIRGYRLEPGEIAAVVRAHPGVADAHVGAVEADDASRDDASWNDASRGGADVGGGRHIVAWYVPRNPAAALRATLLPTLAQINASETDYLYQEIFVDHAYGACGIRLPDDAVVFDVGANIGMFSLYVGERCTRPVIHAFEPIPKIHAALAANLARHVPQAVLHQTGLSAQGHDERFTYYPGYSTMSGETRYADAPGEVAVIKTYLRNQQDAALGAVSHEAAALLANADALLAERFAGEVAECRLERLSDVIAREGVAMIDLLKIDVQRAELDVLMGIDAADWPKIQQIAMEVHDGTGTPTEGRLAVLIDLLEREGFTVRVEQGALLDGTDRFNLYAQRADYVARLGDAGRLTSQDAAVGEAELRSFVADRLADYAVPAAFIALQALPLTANGKVDRAALPRPARDRRSGAAIEAAATVEERLMAQVWCDVLGLDQVGVTDNFFQLGGDSIRSIQIQALARKRGLSFSLPAIFRHQTIRELLRETDAAASVAPLASEQAFAGLAQSDRERLPEDVEDAYPLAALQAAMLYHVALSGRATTYHNATAHEIFAPLDVAALEAAIAETIESHAILRTSFDIETPGETLQRIHRRATADLAVRDLTGLGADEQRALIEQALGEEARRPFDVAVPPLLRLAADRLDEHRFVLTVAEFHAILDGWSLHLLIAELCRRYERRRLGEPSPAATPVVAFRRFVALEQETQASPEARAFWRETLAGVAPAPLPRGAADRAPHRTRRVPILVPDDVATRLQDAAFRAQVPLKSLLLAVHGWAIACATGTRDVVTGLVVNGRPEQEDGDRALGLFINTVPFRIAVQSEESWATLARRAFATEGALAPYRRMPLGDVQRLSGAATPLIDSFFNFTHFHAARDDAGEAPPGHAGYADIAVDIDFPISVDFERAADSDALRVYLQYDAAHFSIEQVRGWAAVYHAGLQACAADPDAPIGATADTAGLALETRIARIWAEGLGVDRVDRWQRFDTLGGHSLLAMRIRARLAREHGIHVALDAFRCGVTVADLAALAVEDAQ